MSNIFEALEQAQREKTEAEIPSVISLPEKGRPEKTAPPKRFPFGEKRDMSHVDLAMEAEMFCLHQNIEYLLPGTHEKTILFMGFQGGEGVSTIVRGFAKMAAARLDKSVLIMDAALHNPSQHLYFNLKGGAGWKDIMRRGEPVDKACHQLGEKKLFLSPGSPHALTPHLYDHPAATGFLEELKNKFDYVLIDSSPAVTSPDGIAISRFTDGVVLVMEAERTRFQVIESIRKKIVRNGGVILGIVFNRRRYYIPECIYKRLH